MLCQSRTTSLKRGDLVVLGTAKLRHRKGISVPTMRGGDVSKRILMEFTIAFNEIHCIVLRNSKLAWPRRSASRWTSWHRKITPIAHPLRSTRDIGKMVYLTEQIRQECTDETPIRLPRSTCKYAPSPPWVWIRATCTDSSLSISEVASSSSSSTLWWQWNEHWWSSFCFEFVVARSLTADGNLLQPTGGVNRTPSHVTFSHICTHV